MATIAGVSPGQQIPTPAVRRAGWRSRLERAATPRRLGLLLALLILLSLAWGVLAALTANQHASAAADVVAVREPLSLDAQQIYASLSDADATAASAFLAGGLEPAAARQRYQADITEAAIRIEAASALVGSSAARTELPGHLANQVSAAGSAVGDDLAMLSGQLPVYTEEVGTARADNRLGLPLGAAYLREASGLLRGTLLPSASDIYTRESALLTSASAQATGLPLIVIAVVAGLGLGYVLYRSSRWLSRHTHRVVNYGLLLAALAGLVSLVWLAGSFVGRPGRPAARAAAGFRAGRGVRPGGGGGAAGTRGREPHPDRQQRRRFLPEGLPGPEEAPRPRARHAAGRHGQRAGRGAGPGVVQRTPGTARAGRYREPWQRGAVRADRRRRHQCSRGCPRPSARGSKPTRPSSPPAPATAGTRSPGSPGMIVASLVMVAGCAWGLSRRLAEYR